MGATTNRAYPYPEASDPPYVHLDLKALAEALDVDTGALFGTWTSYTPTWRANGSTAGLSSGSTGSLTGRYRLVGKTLDLRIVHVLSGSGVAGGTGAWDYSLPAGITASASMEQTLACKTFVTSSGDNFTGFGLVGVGSSLVLPYSDTASGDCRKRRVQNADAAATSGTGVPTVAGAYTFNGGGNVTLTGRIEVA